MEQEGARSAGRVEHLLLERTIHHAGDEGVDHLATWLKNAETAWDTNGKGNRTFIEQLDYIGQLSSQFPVAPLRVVYAKAGSLPAACLIRDERAMVDHKLYWSKPSSEAEANYLCAILNSETARSGAEGYQSRGQFGARDFDKVIFNLPIPPFDSRLPLHRELAVVGAHAEAVAALVELKDGEKFQRARKRVRDALAEEGVGGEIEKLVEKLLGPV